MSFLSPYVQSLSQTKDEQELALIPNQVKQGKTRGELEALRIEEQIIALEIEARRVAQMPVLNWERLLAALDQVALARRKLEQLRVCLEELFPAKAEEGAI